MGMRMRRVLDLGRLVERMQQRLARRVPEFMAGGRNLGGSQRFHGTMVIQARTGGTLRAAGAQQRDASGP